MKYRRKFIIKVIVMSIVMVLISSCSKNNNNRTYPKSLSEESMYKYKTKEQAEEYAIKLFNKKYPEIDLKRYDVFTLDESKTSWVVYTTLKVGRDRPILGGGGPSVTFHKLDGRIEQIYLQK